MKRQEGVTLLASLVLMLVLGLLGASALQGALLQARMAGNLAASLRGLAQAEEALAAGESQLLLARPPPCTSCLPPANAHDDNARSWQPWRSTEDGFYLLQGLGQSSRARHVPAGRTVELFRVTAASREAPGRHVLESIVALEEGGTPKRIAWRQRLRED